MNYNNHEKSADLDPFTLGYNYKHGIGVEKDEHKAFVYYQKSADMGNAKGIYQDGECYYYGTGVEKDKHRAFIYYQKSVEMGNDKGTYMVIRCYLDGNGVEKDEKKVLEYFKKAADMGNASSILQVGDCYRNGIGVPRDIQRANHWYRIERGINRINKSSYENFDDNLKKILDDDKYQLFWIPYSEFQNIEEIGKGGFATVYHAYWLDKNRNLWTPIPLKLIHGSNKSNQEIVKDEHEAFVYYQKSADMGNPKGIYQVGQCYYYGIGVEKDDHKAFVYYQTSADMGNAEGIYQVGQCYYYGIGVEKNEYQYFIYNQKCAEMGHAAGTSNVGYCYEKGIGVEKNEHKEFIYYQKSAEMGDDSGTLGVGRCYYLGLGVEKDEHKAFIFYQKSAEMGHDGGTYMVGHCYLNGIGVETDEKKAFEYFKKAVDMGNSSAILEIGDCYRNGIGVPRDIQRANHWYRIERGVNRINKSSYENVDENLKKILNDEKYQLLWIPYNEFQDIREIGKGGFATVYFAYWDDRNKNLWTPIALKLIHGSNKSNQEFVEELKTYCDIGYENPSFLKCYGISRDDKSKDYIIVLKYANKGSLRQNLGSVARMKWKDKLNVLYSIASDLESIHSQELIHRDLHSGNILQNHLHSAYITDLGLSKSCNVNQKEGINGVMPYVAPEVLMGKPFTQAADIYGFGVIMSEISTGKRAFDGESFNISLSLKICQGERPEFGEGTPDCYIELAKRCMNQDQNKRPTATVIGNINGYWLDEISQDGDREIKKQFLEADKIKLNIESSKHPDHMYTSKLINTREITNRLDLAEIPDDY